MKNNYQRGFTLIEVMVTVSILALVSILVLGMITDFFEFREEGTALVDLRFKGMIAAEKMRNDIMKAVEVRPYSALINNLRSEVDDSLYHDFYGATFRAVSQTEYLDATTGNKFDDLMLKVDNDGDGQAEEAVHYFISEQSLYRRTAPSPPQQLGNWPGPTSWQSEQQITGDIFIPEAEIDTDSGVVAPLMVIYNPHWRTVRIAMSLQKEKYRYLLRDKVHLRSQNNY